MTHPSQALLQGVQDDELGEVEVLLRGFSKYPLGAEREITSPEAGRTFLKPAVIVRRGAATRGGPLFLGGTGLVWDSGLTMLLTFLRMVVRPLMTRENLYLEMLIRHSLLCSVLTLVCVFWCPTLMGSWGGKSESAESSVRSKQASMFPS